MPFFKLYSGFFCPTDKPNSWEWECLWRRLIPRNWNIYGHKGVCSGALWIIWNISFCSWLCGIGRERYKHHLRFLQEQSQKVGGGVNELKTWFYLKINNWEGRDDVFSELLVLSEGPWVTCPALARELWLFAAAPCTLSWEEPLPKVWETSRSENSSKSGKRCGWTLLFLSLAAFL